MRTQHVLALAAATFSAPGLLRAEQPFTVAIRVDAAKPVHKMQGGLGASMHAIEKPMLPHKPDGGMVGGSAWGGNPAPDDDAAWTALFQHADWLGLDWCRVELEQRMYEPELRRFEWDNAEMRILYRILDWAEKRNVDVFLQQMWGNVEWNAIPELRDSNFRIAHSHPHSLDEYAYGLGELIEHLTRRKGYKCIKWLAIVNEPNIGWWQGADGKAQPIAPGLKTVRGELDRRGLKIPLSGPDWTGMERLEPERNDFDPYIGAYDLHSYGANFDGAMGGYPLSAVEQRMKAWADWAHSNGKPFFLSELGTMIFGFRRRDEGPGTYEALIKDAALVVRGIRAGVDGFNRWSFVNRGDLDGQWQLVDTWDADRERLLARFHPHPNSYSMYGLLTRFTAKASSAMGTDVTGNPDPRGRQVIAATLRSPTGQVTVIVVNESYRPAEASFDIAGLPPGRSLMRYTATRALRDRVPGSLDWDRRIPVSGNAVRFQDYIPGLSIAIYTTYDIAPDSPGIGAEKD